MEQRTTTLLDEMGTPHVVGDVSMDLSPKEIFQLYAKKEPDLAPDFVGGKQEFDKLEAANFALDTGRSSIKLLDGDKEDIPLEWDKPMTAQSKEAQAVIMNSKEVELYLALAMPNA